ncbi:hypothetical protein D3C77_561050 [compost metagenome]
MAAGPHAHGSAQEHHADQAIHRQFLGPGKGVVQHVAGEKLQEDQQGHHPEYAQANPVFRLIAGQVDRVLVGLFEAVDDVVDAGLVRAG